VSFYPSKEEAGLLAFGWRFGWAAPCIEFWSLKVASGFLFDDRLAHHALPGSFSFQCSRRCQTGYRATQTLFTILILPIACQNLKTSSQRQVINS